MVSEEEGGAVLGNKSCCREPQSLNFCQSARRFPTPCPSTGPLLLMLEVPWTGQPKEGVGPPSTFPAPPNPRPSPPPLPALS